MKKGQIYGYHLEIQRWFNEGSVLYFFSRSRITDFYKDCSARIDTIVKEIVAMQKQHFVFETIDDKERIKAVDGQPVLLEGKTMADANQAMQDLMDQTVTEPLKLIKPN